MRVLLTGVTGFIGSYCAAQWYTAGHEVIGIARNNLHQAPALPYKVYWADLADGVPLSEGVDVLVHAAAQSPKPSAATRDFIRSNIDAIPPLIAYARKFNVPRCIFLSSLSLYGQVQQPVLDEDTPRINPDVYGTTKYLGEELFKEEQEWLSSIILRLPGVVGPHSENPWLARVSSQLLKGDEVLVYNPEALFNNVVHVSDLERFILHLCTRQVQGVESLCLGSAEPLTVMQTVRLLKERLGSNSPIHAGPSPHGSFTISIQKAQQCGYNPLTTHEVLERYTEEIKIHIRNHETHPVTG